MKIGIETRCVGTNRRGFERYTVNLLQALERIGGGHQYVLFTDHPTDPRELGLGDRFTVRVIPKQVHTLWWLNVQLPAAVREEQVDLIHFTANECWARTVAPTTVTFHDAGTMLNPQEYAAGAKARIYFKLLKLILPRADRIVTVSASSKNDIASYLRVEDDKIEVTYEGIDPRFFEPVPNTAVAVVRSEYKLPERYALFLSALDKRKNIIGAVKGFLQAFSQGEFPLKLVVAGETLSGKGARYLTVKEIRRETGCGSEVVFIGGIPFDQLPGLYAGAEFLLLPSFYEGFGLPYIEAQACGTPVIAANTTTGPELVGETGLLVDPNDTAAIAAAVKRLAGDVELRRELSNRGRENARKYTGEVCAGRLVKVWNNALA